MVMPSSADTDRTILQAFQDHPSAGPLESQEPRPHQAPILLAYGKRGGAREPLCLSRIQTVDLASQPACCKH